jgi:hypothetical protein
MNGDKLTRVAAVLAVLAVAGVAAWVSYRHCLAVVAAHGEPGGVGYAYPATIDGLIVAASLVLLDSARHGERAPRLAWWALGGGIVATIAVNVLAGLGAGALGAVVAAWPAGALVASYELLMMLVRASARRAVAGQAAATETAAQEPDIAFREMVGLTEELGLYDEAGQGGESADDADKGAGVPEVPRDAEHAALMALRATHAAGNILSGRQVEARFGISRSTAAKLRKSVLGEPAPRPGAEADDSETANAAELVAA